MKLSACVEWLFADNDRPFPDRIRRARAAGLDAVEWWEWTNKDHDAVRTALSATGLPVAAMLSEPTGQLTDRSTHEAFLAGLDRSLEIATDLGARSLIVVSGDTLPDVSLAEQRRAVVDVLKAAGPKASTAGVRLVLEPINLEEQPGCFLSSLDEGLGIVEQVGDPAVVLLADLYHASVMGEDIRAAIGSRVALIGHVHVADHPDRHEPGTGVVDWTSVLEWLDGAGYRDYVGLEFMPSVVTEHALRPVMAIRDGLAADRVV